MRALLQRAAGAQVAVDGEVIGHFEGPGLVMFVGVTHDDTAEVAERLADKAYGLRIFEHRHARDVACLPPGTPKEVSAQDLSLPVLVISQFTLFADTRKGRRPTWDNAAPGEFAEPLIDDVAAALRRRGAHVATGRFGADMQVSLTNDGPITIQLEVPSSM